MKCPYCEKEMRKGVIRTGNAITSITKVGEVVTWIPEGEERKVLPKETLNLDINGEGYYCDKCEKVIAVFSERGATFCQ